MTLTGVSHNGYIAIYVRLYDLSMYNFSMLVFHFILSHLTFTLNACIALHLKPSDFYNISMLVYMHFV